MAKVQTIVYEEKQRVIGPHEKTVRDQKFFLKPSMTQQQFLEETKTTNIISKYRRTGMIPIRNGQPFYGDFSGAEDFHTAQNKLLQANQMFMLLPAEIRDRFKNDPGNLLEFLAHEENRPEAEKLGILPPRKADNESKTQKKFDADEFLASGQKVPPKKPEEAKKD